MQWERGWTYELRWAAGHSGVRSRVVDSPAKLRAVVEWARRNDRVEKCTYRVTYELVGERIEQCPQGHSLLTPRDGQPYRTEKKMRQVECIACPAHWATTCPVCFVVVFDPVLLEGCGPIPEAT